MISVIIGTYGSSEWRDLAMSRAYPSAFEQAQTFAVHHAEGTLATARNSGAAQSRGSSHLVFLDADDELVPGYIAAMTDAIRDYGGPMILLTPAIEYVGVGGRCEPVMFHPEVPIEQGNWLIIGTCVPRALFLEIGGFEEYPKYEDWAAFARMQRAGARVVKVPEAIYRAHRNPHGRNHEGGRNAKLAAHDQIRRAVFPELYA